MTEKPTPQPPSKNRRAATGQLDTFSEPRPRFRSGDLPTARAKSRPSPDRRAPRRHAEVLARGPRGVPRQVPAESRSAVDFGRRPPRPQSPPRYARGPTEVLAQDLPKRLGDGMPEYLPEVRANCHAGVAARVPIGRLSALSGVPAVFAAVLLRSPLRIRAKGRRRHGQVLARGSADVLAQALHDHPATARPSVHPRSARAPHGVPVRVPVDARFSSSSCAAAVLPRSRGCRRAGPRRACAGGSDNVRPRTRRRPARVPTRVPREGPREGMPKYFPAALAESHAKSLPESRFAVDFGRRPAPPAVPTTTRLRSH